MNEKCIRQADYHIARMVVVVGTYKKMYVTRNFLVAFCLSAYFQKDGASVFYASSATKPLVFVP